MILPRFLPAGAAILFGAAALAAQSPLLEVDRFGPQVGEAAPDFALVDQNGRTRDLTSILGPGGALLVFSRSAAW